MGVLAELFAFLPTQPLGAYLPCDNFFGYQHRIHLPSASVSLKIGIVYGKTKFHSIVIRECGRNYSHSSFSTTHVW
jgi:hypothetical protein